MNLPPDVTAYLAQAAQQLMAEQDFQPTSVEEIEGWLSKNAAATGQRAKDLQDAMFVKYLAHQEKIVKVISADVYREIHTRALNQDCNRRIEEVLQ